MVLEKTRLQNLTGMTGGWPGMACEHVRNPERLDDCSEICRSQKMTSVEIAPGDRVIAPQVTWPYQQWHPKNRVFYLPTMGISYQATTVRDFEVIILC